MIWLFFLQCALAQLPVIPVAPVAERRAFGVNITLGSNDQPVGLRVDIGQPGIWVLDNCFSTCSPTTQVVTTTKDSSTKTMTVTTTSLQSEVVTYTDTSYTAVYTQPAVCAERGTYNMNSSSSGKYYNVASGQSGEQDYVSLLFSNFVQVGGFYVEDILTTETLDSKINVSAIFIDVNDTSLSAGGLGLATHPEQDGFLDRLVDEEYINSSSYSLALSLNSSYGELILGGIDTSRFQGPLVQFPFIPLLDPAALVSNGWTNDLPIVPFSGMSIENSEGKVVRLSESYSDGISSGSYPKPVILDSRTYYSYLPYSTLVSLAIQLNAYYSASLSRWLVDCDIRNAGVELLFHFGNLTINTPLSRSLRNALDHEGGNLFFENGNPACFLTFLPDYFIGFAMLGTPFLENVYLAVDNEARNIAMAQVQSLTSSTKLKRDESTSASAAFTSGLSVYSANTSSTLTSYKSTMAPIESGTIPFAVPNNVESYSLLTLTMATQSPTAAVPSDNVVVSDGEIYIGGTGLPTPMPSGAKGSNTSSYYAGASRASFGILTLISLFVAALV